MKNRQQEILNYSILSDPHMYYYLQSAQKVKELLKTNLYRLEAGRLVEKESKQSIKL